MKYGLGEYTVIFKALSDETRLRILTMLTKGRTCACKILEEFRFTQPTLSYHMKQLSDSGLVDAEKDGKWVHYTINGGRLELLQEFIAKIKESGNSREGCCEEDPGGTPGV